MLIAQMYGGSLVSRSARRRSMAGVAIYLASRAGAYLTGAVIPVDGEVASVHT